MNLTIYLCFLSTLVYIHLGASCIRIRKMQFLKFAYTREWTSPTHEAAKR